MKRVSQLEQLYRDGMSRWKDQTRKQEKERLDRERRHIALEQKALYEKKLQDEKEARTRELRLVQEELERIADQAVSLRARLDEMLGQREVPGVQKNG